jgi:hypothetical protein
MNACSGGKVLQGHGVPNPDLRTGPCLYRISQLETVRRQDVAIVTVPIVDEGDAGRPVRVVLTLATLPGTPSLSRLKSIMRSSRREPPPRWRTVIRPWLLRPAFRFSETVSDFSGAFFVTSSKVYPLIPRRPGDVGLYCFTGIFRSVYLHP